MKKIYILLALFCCMGHWGFAQVTVTPASGGSAICGPLPSCTALDIITITETNIADFASGSDQLVLAPPAGWQFCTVTTPTVNFSGGGDITGVASGGFTTTALTINVTCGGTSNPDAITISGLMVQPLTSTSVPGAITASSVTGINGITPGVTDFGDLALFPGQINGAIAVCAGNATTLSDAATGGTWSSSNTGIATIDPVSGSLTSITGTSGITVITYSVSPGCSASVTFSVVTTPDAITGPTSVCSGGSFIHISDATTGGTWSSSSTAVATVNALGVLIGGTAGTTVISYETSPLLSCASATSTVTVIAPPAAMTPSVTVCSGSNITLSDPAGSGGTWSSNSTTVATVDVSLGIVLGSSVGTAVITYATGCGTAATTTVTVIASPGPITGPTSLCSGGAIITLSDDLAGGSWTSSNSSVATIDPVAGTVTSTLPGTTVISYLTTCTAVTSTVTVLSSPASIIATANLCSGSTETASDAVPHGTWSSSTTTVATVDSNLGTVYGVAGGMTNLTYSTGCGTPTTKTINVIPAPTPIIGVAPLCSGGAMLTLSDTTSGGNWSSSVSTIATVDPALGTVTGSAPGTTVIDYSTGCGTDATATITVLTTPGTITGATSTVCVGASITLSDAVTGGTWSTSSTALATADSVAGVIYGVAAGAITITYSTGCGTPATAAGTVRRFPGPILGGLTVCSGGSTITLSDAVPAGTWSSATTTVATIGSTSGVVTGGITGTTTITYTNVCGSSSATVIVPCPTAAISPASASVCVGSGITLSDPTAGGTWSSSSTALATVDSATGVVSGVTGTSGGTVVITYSTGCGAVATATVTVIATPLPITGASTTVCSGAATLVLSDAIAGGTWSSATTAVATIGSVSGSITGGIAGTAVITYSTGCGTSQTTTVTVIAIPVAISPGSSNLCSGGATETLSDAVSGGTWSVSTSTVATIGSATGVVTSVGTGTAFITYSTGCGTAVSATVTVINGPTAISPVTAVVCTGSTITLSDGTAGGTWSSSLTAIATVDVALGVVTGSAVGTAVISYSIGCGTAATRTVTVLGTPVAISPAVASICSGANITLSDATAGGTWTSSSTTVATVGSVSGVVTGIGTGGTTLITYATGCGAAATMSVTVTGIPVAISGLTSVCSGNFNITLSDAVTGGTWSTSVSAVATVNPVSGVVTSGVAGSTLITYSTGCGANATHSVTVLGTPVAISPAVASICSGANITLSDATAGGTWTSSSTTVATVGSVSGVVTGIGTGGTTLITYATGCGAAATMSVTVTGIPGAISGALTVCSGNNNITLSDAIAGGTWSTSVSAVATVGPASGVVTSGVAGSTLITYSTGCGTDATHSVTVLGTPVAISPAVASICSGANITLSDATAGGTWTSSSTTVATVGSVSGIVTGTGTGGTVLITYSTGCLAAVTRSVTVTGIPTAISGLTSVCSGNFNITLSDAVPSGTWSTSTSAVATIGSATGIVTSGIAGITTITYETSCASSSVTVTVLGTPVALSPTYTICANGSATFSDATTGGTWSTNNSSIAAVGSVTGLVTGHAAGTAIITYSTGCSASATTTVTVIGIPVAISPATASICQVGNVTLSDATASGTWSSNNTGIAAIGSATGIVTGGVTTGTAIISYSTGCGAIATSTVNVLGIPDPIAGLSAVCPGSAITLSNDITGGTWSSGTTAVATVAASTGVVTGGIGGAATITYSTGCGTAATTTVTVTSIPGAISGTPSACFGGGSTTLSDAIPGGTWSSNNTVVATVDPALGVVTGGVPGAATISYSTSCGIALVTVTISSSPGAITGSSFVCPGFTVTLSDNPAGGAWSSSNTSVATVDPGLGTVTGVTAGAATITYFTGCGAGSVLSFTVNPLPALPGAISGSADVCTGSSITLSDSPTGGVWSSDNTTIGTINSTGTLSALTNGTVTVTYTVSNSCGSNSVSSAIIVDTPIAAPAAITGAATVCQGATISLSDATASGVWSSSNTLIIVGSSGVCYGVAGGSSAVSYTISNACSAASSVVSVTVMPLPSPDSISGYTDTLCAGSSVPLSDATPGGVWSSAITGIANVSATGVVTAVTGGDATIFYSMTNSCGAVAANIIVTVAAIPAIDPVTGSTSVCAGSTISLTDATTGGVWSSSATGIAIAGSTGTVTAVSAGVATISYTKTFVCGVESATALVTVGTEPVSGIITGNDYVCVGYTTALSDNIAGGVWSSDDLSTAIVTAAGVVNGIGTGTVTISYTVTNSCGTATAVKIINVISPSGGDCLPSGVNALSATETGLKIFPNPNAGAFTLNLSSVNNEAVTVIITNLVGDKVKEFTTITNTDTQIQLDAAAGIYFVTAVTKEGTLTRKIVVQ